MKRGKTSQWFLLNFSGGLAHRPIEILQKGPLLCWNRDLYAKYETFYGFQFLNNGHLTLHLEMSTVAEKVKPCISAKDGTRDSF